MVNLVEFAHTVELLNRIASPAIVNRALHAAGVNRKLLKAGPGFVPYVVEAVFLESTARAMGDGHIGARLGQEFDYTAYRGFADYVLGARDLATALVRSRRALPLIHPGADVVLQESGDNLVIGFETGLGAVVGRRHIEEGAIFVMNSVFRHFLGADWRPDRIDVIGDRSASVATMADIAGAPIRVGASIPAVSVRVSDLTALNPAPPAPEEVITLGELPALMGVTQPQTTQDAVRQILRMQLALGDLSEDSVARRLSLGPRTLQRVLKGEGTSFRDVKARFIEERARTLLSETDLAIGDIARSIGYDEPNSFRRAFSSWTGSTPGHYRAAARQARSA